MTKIRFAALAILAITLTGCAGRFQAGGEATHAREASATPVATTTETLMPTPSASSTATAIPESTEIPTGTAFPPALGDLKLSSEGLGYIRVGRPVPPKPKGEALVTWSDDFCKQGLQSPSGGWNTAYGDFLGSGSPSFYVSSRSQEATVDDIYIFSTEIRTAHGLRIGSSLEDVKTLGGTIVPNVGPPGYEDAWVIHGSAGELVFWVATTNKSETPKDVVAWLQVQRENSVPHFEFEYGCE